MTRNASKHVLVADPSGLLARNLERNLKDSCQISVVKTGKETILGLFNDKPDLLIIEEKLADSNAIQVAQILKQKKFSIPMLLLLQQQSTLDSNEIESHGFSDSFQRPFNIPNLVEKIKEVLSIEPYSREREEKFSQLLNDIEAKLAKHEN